MKQPVSGTQKELIEQAAQMIAADNAELATAFLEKTAVEKAIPEIDKRLTNVRELLTSLYVLVCLYNINRNHIACVCSIVTCHYTVVKMLLFSFL